MPRVREYCAKFVRGVVPRGPRKFVQNMRVGIKNCAEIVQNLCGTILAQKIGGASESMSAQILRIFPTRLEHFSNTKQYRQINSQPWRVEGGEIVQNYCHCISWEKATTIKMQLPKCCFSCAFGRSRWVPCWPSFRTPCRPPFWLDLSKIIFIVISASLILRGPLRGLWHVAGREVTRR